MATPCHANHKLTGFSFTGKDGWKKVVVCIVSDGRLKINSRTLSVLAAMGVYQEGVAKNVGKFEILVSLFQVL